MFFANSKYEGGPLNSVLSPQRQINYNTTMQKLHIYFEKKNINVKISFGVWRKADKH